MALNHRLRLLLCFGAVLMLAGIAQAQSPDSSSIKPLADTTAPGENIPDPLGTAPGRTDTSLRLDSIEILITDSLHPDYARLVNIARQITPYEPGQAFGESWLEEAGRRFTITGKFSGIHFETLPSSKGGVRLQIHLTPFYFVKKIQFKNNFPLYLKELQNVMTLRTGSGYSQALVEEQKPLLEKLFQRQGIHLKPIEAKVEKDPKDGNYSVEFIFTKDYWLTLGTLKTEGAHFYDQGNWEYQFMGLRKLNPFFHRKRFVEKKYKANLKKIRERYLEKGFYNIDIKDSVIIDSLTHKVHMHFKVREGPRSIILWEGNEHFCESPWWWRCKLDDQLDFASGNRNNLGFKKSIGNLKDFYHSQGFQEANISFKVQPQKSGEKYQDVILKIEEGLRTRVKAIVVAGNKTMPLKKIEGQILSKEKKGFNPDTYIEDVAGIKALYLQNGYYGTTIDTGVTISPTEKKEYAATLKFNILEGKQRLIEDIHWSDTAFISSKAFYRLTGSRPGDPYVPSLLRADKVNLSARVAEMGYPHCEIHWSAQFSPDSSRVSLTYRLEPGKKVYSGNIYYTGNFKTKPSVMEREMEIPTGEPLSLRRILEAQREVSNLPLFQSVQFKPMGLQEKFDSVSVFLDLEEKPPYYLSLSSGFQSDIGVLGAIKVGDINLWGFNKHGWVGGNVNHTTGEVWLTDELGWMTEAGILEPRLFGTKIAATLVAAYERENETGNANQDDYYTDIYSATLGFTRTYFKRLTLGTSFAYELRKTTGSEDNLGGRNNLVTRPSAIYDTRDSFIRPRRGLFASYIIEWSESLFQRGSRELDDEFLKHHIVAKTFYTPTSFLTLAAIGRWSIASKDSLPEDQALYLGGTGNVRGYTHNSLDYSNGGGNFSVSGSLEARLDLGGNFELPLFMDIGRVSRVADRFDPQEYSLWKVKRTFGTGIRYMTPIGPIGILYGHKLDPVAYGAWHFSIGYTF